MCVAPKIIPDIRAWRWICGFLLSVILVWWQSGLAHKTGFVCFNNIPVFWQHRSGERPNEQNEDKYCRVSSPKRSDSKAMVFWTESLLNSRRDLTKLFHLAKLIFRFYCVDIKLFLILPNQNTQRVMDLCVIRIIKRLHRLTLICSLVTGCYSDYICWLVVN